MAEDKLVWSAEEIDAAPFDYAHPLDNDAKIQLFALSRLTGLGRASVSLGRLAPGCHSFPTHLHHAEEEWIYILSGQGRLWMDERIHQISAGGFAAFPAGGPAHKLENTGDETLVYLMGGENQPLDIIDFPELGQRLNRLRSNCNDMDIAPEDAFRPYDAMANSKPVKTDD